MDYFDLQRQIEAYKLAGMTQLAFIHATEALHQMVSDNKGSKNSKRIKEQQMFIKYMLELDKQQKEIEEYHKKKRVEDMEKKATENEINMNFEKEIEKAIDATMKKFPFITKG